MDIESDRRLLGLIQSSVPLVREPFAALAADLGCSEAAVLERLRALHAPGGVLREIAAILDAARLGYAQSLVAFRVSPDRLDEAGTGVAGHPGVSHCYGRDGACNLWFTLATSPTSALGLAGTVALLARRAGAADRMILPMLRRYKLDVRFGAARGLPHPPAATNDAPAAAPSAQQVRAIRALQVDLPLRPDPFASLAARAGLSADDLLACGADFLAAGWMRRYAAVLHHRAAGARANVMVVWRVDEADADAAGAQCAEFAAVSHCYLRPTHADWPYNLYTMIHGADRDDCEDTIRRIAAAAGLGERLALWTTREYKKRRVRLFTDDERRWERERADF